MKESEFNFASVDLLYYKFHKISLNCGGLYIDTTKQLKNKNDNKCFQYAITVALNY